MCDREHFLDVLGLKPSASHEEIVNAYRVLMEYWNPDRVPDFYKQKAMEGRDKVEVAYQELMGLRKKDQKGAPPLTQKLPEQKKADQSITEKEGILLKKDKDGTLVYLDKKSIAFNKDKIEISVNIYPPEGSTRFNTAHGYIRRAGYGSLECIAEKWGIGLSNKVFIRYGQFYKSTCGRFVEATADIRKVWKPITPGTLEEIAWKVVDGILKREKMA